MAGADSFEEPGNDAAQEQPRAPRHSVFLSARVEHFNAGAPSHHRVRDLSAGGVRIDGAASFQPGATVLVSVGALEAVGAAVVWVKGDWAGLKFAKPIDPAAARAKAAVAPQPFRGQAREAPAVAPTAGWMPSRESPYRR